MTLIELLLTLQGMDRMERQMRMNELEIDWNVQDDIHASFNGQGQLVDGLDKVINWSDYS